MKQKTAIYSRDCKAHSNYQLKFLDALLVTLLIFSFSASVSGIAQQPRDDGACGLLGLYSFTDGSQIQNPPTRQELELNYEAYSYAAAQMMAIEHFNNRNDSIIPKLNKLISSNCTVHFPDFTIRDAEKDERDVYRHLMRQYSRYNERNLCGAIHRATTRGPVTFVESIELPYILHAGGNSFFGRSHSVVTTYLTNVDYANSLVHFLQSKLITHLGVLSGGRFGQDEWGRALKAAANRTNITLQMENIGGATARPEGPGAVKSALESLKTNGYRVIAIAPEDEREATILAQACDELNMLTNDYLYLLDQDSLRFLNSNLTSAQNLNMMEVPFCRPWMDLIQGENQMHFYRVGKLSVKVFKND